MRDFCLITNVYVLVGEVSGVSCRCCRMSCISAGLEQTISDTSPWISLGQGVTTVRLMHSYPGLSSRERTALALARRQQTPCWCELVTSGGEKGLLAAVRQECDSTDTSECLGESWGGLYQTLR